MESLAVDLRTMARRPLAQSHVDALMKVGTVRQFAAGEELVRLGDSADIFYYLIDGEVEAVAPITNQRYGDATLGPTQFFGEISFLHGGKTMMGARCIADSTVLCVARQDVLALMAQIPEMGDIIVTVLAGRRRRLLESEEASLTLVGGEVDRTIRSIASFATRNRIPTRILTLGEHEAEAVTHACSISEKKPAVIFGKDQVVDDPTPAKIAQLLGIDMQPGDQKDFDVLIVGAGPAGVAAAVYAGAEGLSALVIDDTAIGGQAGTSSRIENYMGFPTGISGADLVWRGEIQAMKFGAQFAVPRRACAIRRCEKGNFTITLDDGMEVVARAVVVATGVQYRRLPLKGLQQLEGAGVYYAATDIEARYCRDTEVVIVGGGNSAGQAAMYLSRTAKHVHLLVRGNSLAASMSDYLSSRLEADPTITIHYNSQISVLHGDDHLEAVTITNTVDAKEWRLDTRGAFIMVGAAPNTGWLADCADLDAKGFVKTGSDVGETSPYSTSMPGLFAVGDVRSGSVKRVASSVGEGSVVISKVWDHVNATS